MPPTTSRLCERIHRSKSLEISPICSNPSSTSSPLGHLRFTHSSRLLAHRSFIFPQSAYRSGCPLRTKAQTTFGHLLSCRGIEWKGSSGHHSNGRCMDDWPQALECSFGMEIGQLRCYGHGSGLSKLTGKSHESHRNTKSFQLRWKLIPLKIDPSRRLNKTTMWALCCTEPATNDSDVVNVQEGEPLLPAGEVEQAEITKISERTPEATLAEEVKAEESKPEKKKEESKPEKKVSLSANPAEAFEVPEIVCNRVTTRSRLQPLPTKQRNAAQQGKTSAPPAQSPEQRDTTPPPPPPRGGEGERKTDRASQKSGISTQRASVRSSRRASAISSHSTASAMFLKGFMDVRRRNRTSVVSHHHGRVTAS
eukprot:symbB.v1.2.007009.t1/scaffold385.1/size305797/5